MRGGVAAQVILCYSTVTLWVVIGRGITAMATRSNRTMRRFSIGARLIGAGFALVLAAGGPAHSDDAAAGLASPSPRFFKICENQTYALCAVAKCFVFNGVAYCKCDVESGNSISLPLNYDSGQDVCSVNAEGAQSGYMVSTFSLAMSVVAPNGNRAIYDCPASTSDGAYAQCDGGVCFTSSEGQSFPGFTKPLNKDQIICACPITVANPATAMAGYQIAGPYPCRKSFFRYCNSAAANTKTGSTIYVGAPTGTARLLTRELYGSVPMFNRCLP
jgi:hypothetical protein